jgi:WD40 repeat protein
VTNGATLTLISRAAGPYPGLRPFDDDEAEIFFGRETQTDQLLEKLQRSHFIAVVGPSGCGKSSLVRAGMIPALESGFLADTGTGWRIAEMRPSDQPLARLADALLQRSGLGPEHGSDASEVAIVRAMLRRGPLGILEILGETPLPKNSNLLLLVDQFEEIFRFRKQGSADEADAFVALLLATVAQREAPVYIVITMRSDFLGDCALFAGLPEAINDGQYLTPRLTREQIRAAITGPARVFGSEVEPALVTRLLNEIGPEPDQLPLLQHVLMRMWTRVQGGTRPDDPTGPTVVTPGPPVVRIEDYEAVGTLSEALSRHADRMLASLTERQQWITRVMLTRLTERSGDKRDTRRPTRLGDVAAVAGVSDEEVVAVVEPLRGQGCSFLTPPPPVPLRPSTVLDIGHESLIREWHQLADWVEAEATAATRYRRLAERAELHAKGEAGLMTERELELTLEWHDEWRPTAAWAARYHPGFEAGEAFLNASRAARDAAARAKARSRMFRMAAIAASVVLVAGMFGSWVYGQRKSAEADELKLQLQKLKAQTLARDAVDRLPTDPDSALSLALEAFRLDSRSGAKGLLQQALVAGRLRSKTEVGTLRGFGSQDGRFVAVADSTQGTLRVWQTSTGGQLTAPLRLKGQFRRGFFSPRGEVLGVLTEPGRITLWNTGTWRVLSTLQGMSPRQFPSFSYDATRIVARRDETHVSIWETANGSELGRIGADTGTITSASLSQDGKYLLAIDSVHRAASLWDASSFTYLSPLRAGQDRPILAGRFSPDSRQILLTPKDDRFPPTLLPVDDPDHGAKDLPVVDIGKPRPPGTVPSVAFPPLATFSLDGKSILAVSGDSIRVWRWPFEDQPIILAGSGGGIRMARFSQTGRLILSIGGDGAAKLWDIASATAVATFSSPPSSESPASSSGSPASSGASITGAWLSPDAQQLVTTSDDGLLRIWRTVELGTENALAGVDTAEAIPLRSDGEFPAAITPDAKYFLARAADGTASIWDVAKGTVIHGLGEEHVDRMGLSPDGKHAMTSAEGRTARVWNTETGASVAALQQDVPGHSLLLGGFGDDAHPWVWYASDTSAIVAVWQLQGRPTANRPVRVHRPPHCVTVSPDAAWVVTCEDAGEDESRVVRVRHLPSGRVQHSLGGHTGTIIDVFFSRDGRFAASTSYDKTAIIWRVGSWRPVARLSGHEAGVQYALFSPDSRLVVTVDDKYTLRVWETETGKQIAKLRGHTAAVKAFAFSDDGRWLVTGSADNTARIWDPMTGQSVAVLYGHTGPVIAVAFVPNSRDVVTASADGTIRRYPCELCVPTPQLLAAAEQRLTAIRGTKPAAPSGKVAQK